MNVLVTAGPTREEIDAVRYITNRSSGKMGYALAGAARDSGHTVTLISGPTALTPPDGVTFIPVESAEEMAQAVKAHFPDADLTIMAAAVADYRPAHPEVRKRKKQPGPWMLELERTEDILASLGAMKKPGQFLLGFAAETDDLLANAAKKLAAKNLDAIAANDVSGTSGGFGAENNAVTLLFCDGRQVDLASRPKPELAKAILGELPLA